MSGAAILGPNDSSGSATVTELRVVKWSAQLVRPGPAVVARVDAPAPMAEAIHWPVDKLPEDAVIHIWLWLKMEDMMSVSQVSKRWRQLALSTARLWQDVQLVSRDSGPIKRFHSIATRTNLPIDVAIDRGYDHSVDMEAAQEVCRLHGHRIASLEINLREQLCRSARELFHAIPSLRDAMKDIIRTDMQHSSRCWHKRVSYVRFPDLRTVQAVELRGGVFPCGVCVATVRHVRLIDIKSVTMEIMNQLCTAFPDMTSLDIRSDDVPYFGHDNALYDFINRMSGVVKLSIATKLFNHDSQSVFVANLLRWPVRAIELDVSASSHAFARLARQILKEILITATVLTIRSTRQRNVAGEWQSKYSITVQVGSDGGREISFVNDSFTRIAQNYGAYLLREKMIQEVVVDGHGACALFYVAPVTETSHISRDYASWQASQALSEFRRRGCLFMGWRSWCLRGTPCAVAGSVW